MATQFVNPFAAFYTGWNNVLHQQEEKRQQRVKEQQEEERLRLAREADERARRADERAEKDSVLRQTEQQQKIEAAERAAAEKNIREAGPGGKLKGKQAEQAQAQVPFMISDYDEAVPDVSVPPLPPVTLPGMEEGQPGLTLPQGPTEEIAGLEAGALSKGTPDQRAIQTIIDNPEMDDAQKVAILMQGGVDLNAPEAKMLMGGDQEVPLMWDAVGEQLMGQDQKGEYTVPWVGKLPRNYKILNAKDPNSGVGGGVGTKLFSDDTGTYLLTTDTAGNTSKTRVGGTRPYASQQSAITSGNAALTVADVVENLIEDVPVGPVAGRIESMAARYVSQFGTPGYAFFESQVNSLKNQAIKAITGAQMSEPEANRIMKELPDPNLPTETFKARLASFKQNLAIVTKITEMYATGNREAAFDLRIQHFGADNTAAVAATEERLKSLFPNIKIKVGGAAGAPARAGGAGTPAKDDGYTYTTVNGRRVRQRKQ